jgi:putative ABC transport system permease protein
MHLESWWGDVRFAWRNAVRRPGFTLLVALTLALGLGVNSAVFALVDAVLLRPLPYREPSRLVFLWQTLPQQNMFEVEATPYDYSAWQELRSLSSIAMVTFGSFTVTGGTAEPERVRGARLTASMMPTLGITPALGRPFTAAEDFDRSPAVAILGDGLWRRRFGSDPAAIGRSIEIDGTLWTIVGVMPRRALLPGAPSDDNELWLPMRMSPAEATSEISHNYAMIGRLADTATFAQASAELQTFAARLAAERPSHTRIGARLVSVEERSTRTVRPALVVAVASVALLLLVAAANASTLLIARAANRRHELAVRAALGATRGRLLSLSMSEALVFAAIGGGAGLVLGGWTLRALLPLFSASLPASLDIEIGGRAAAFTAALAVLIGVAFGFVAAFRPAERLTDSLTSATRSTASGSVGRTRNLLVVGQVALAVVLLAAAGLMLNTVGRLSRVNPGFAADHVLTFRVALLGDRYSSPPARTAFVSELLDRSMQTSGIRAAAVSSVVPFGGTRNATVVEIEGRQQPEGARAIIDQRHVSAGYFDTMKIAIVSGRGIAATDDSRSERVVVINKTMAQRYFPHENPLDRRVRIGAGFNAGVWFRIVGIADDVRHIALSRDAVAEMYHPIAQTAVPNFTVVLRTAADPASLTAAARSLVHGMDGDLPLYEIRTMEERIAGSYAQTRATMLLLTATAVLAAALAGIAIYGAIWYSVVQRTQEIGIRIALGASRASVFRQVVAKALMLGACGGVLGSGGAAAGGSLLQTFLFDTRTTDPLTHAAVLAGVLILALAAALLPAIRATRIDPVLAIRA